MVTVDKPRRRSEKSRAAIFAATRELALERGFDKLTIEAVAAKAGVGKQTIYRWWPSRAVLVADVLLEDFGSMDLAVPSSGNLTADLIAWARALARSLTTGDFSTSLRILTASAMEDAQTAERLHATFGEPIHTSIRGRLQADGGLDEALAHAAADAIVGGVVYPILNQGTDYPPARAELLARIILDGLPIRTP
jgi:AcrR family transcriptional regulator